MNSKDINEFGFRYSVFEDGSVLNKKMNLFMKPIKNRHGYIYHQFRYLGKKYFRLAHRLIAEAFIPNLENKKQVNHKNGVKIDNRLENLEWCNQSENIKHAYDSGLMKYNGSLNKDRKLTNDQVLTIRKELGTHNQLAEKYGVSKWTIQSIKLGRLYKSL